MRTFKFFLHSLLSLIIFSKASGNDSSPRGPTLGKIAKIGIGAFCEGEQEKYNPAMGEPYATHAIFFAGARAHLLIPNNSHKKVVNALLGGILLEGHIGKLENMCTVRLPVEMSDRRNPVPFVSVYADHSLGFKLRGSKVIYSHGSSSLRAKLRGEMLYGIGHLTKVLRLGKYTKADGLHLLRSTPQGEVTWEEMLHSGCFDNYLSLKRITLDFLVENDITDRITTSIGVYSRWGEWKVGNPLSVGVFGKEYSFKDTLGTSFNVTYKLTENASLNMDSHMGRSKNITVSFKYELL